MRKHCVLRVGSGIRAAALLLAAALGLGGAASAAELQVKTTAAPPSATAPLTAQEGKVELSLDQAIAIALQRNLALVAERYSREENRLGIAQNLGLFDLRSSLSLSHEDDNIAVTSDLEASKTKTTIGNLSLEQLLAPGTDVTVAFNNRRSESNNIFNTLNPSYRSSFGFSVAQPLLRDFGTLATKRNLLIARANSSLSLETFEQQVAQTISDVEVAYWNLVQALDQLNVAQEGLSLAQELDKRNRVQVEVGTLAPLELVQSEATIATRQEAIITAKSAVGDAADALRRLLNLDQGDLWDAEIVPTTDPKLDRQAVDLDGAIKAALVARPELKAKRFDLSRLEIDSTYFRNQKRPRLDFTVSYGYNGVGGNQIEVLDPNLPPTIVSRGDYGDAVQQVIDRKFDSWSAGLVLAYPLQNRAARAASTIADLALQQGRIQLKDLEQSVITEVRTAARAVDTAAQQIESAAVSSRLQQRNLEAEQKRYENGMSTSFQVTQIQDDLTQAKSREVTAITTYRKALVDYYRVIGKLLDESGVELVDQ